MGLLRSLRNKLHAKKRTLKFIMKGGRDKLIGGRRRRRRTANRHRTANRRRSARRRRKRKSKSRGKKRTCPVTGEPICYCKN